MGVSFNGGLNVVGSFNAGLKRSIVWSFDLDSLYYTGKSETFNYQASRMTDLQFTFDGYSCYGLYYNTSKMVQYNLTEPYDISTKSIKTVVSFENNYYGYKMILHNEIWITNWYSLFKNFTFGSGQILSTLSGNVRSADLDLMIDSLDISFDGKKLIIFDYHKRLFIYNLSVPYDITTASLIKTKNGLTSNRSFSMKFFNNGEVFIIREQSSTIFKQYRLSIPYDIDTMVYEKSLDLSTLVPNTDIRAITYDNNSTRIFMVHDSNSNSTPGTLPIIVYEFGLQN